MYKNNNKFNKSKNSCNSHEISKIIEQGMQEYLLKKFLELEEYCAISIFFSICHYQ